MLFNELFIFFFSYIGQRTVIGPSFRILDPFLGWGVHNCFAIILVEHANVHKTETEYECREMCLQ